MQVVEVVGNGLVERRQVGVDQQMVVAGVHPVRAGRRDAHAAQPEMNDRLRRDGGAVLEADEIDRRSGRGGGRSAALLRGRRPDRGEHHADPNHPDERSGNGHDAALPKMRAVSPLPGAELDWQPECCCRARGRQDNLYPTNVKAAAPRSSHGAACTYGRFAPPAELARKANARDEPWPVVSHLADRRRRSRGSRDHRPTRGRPETRRGVSRLRRLCRDGGGAAGRVRDGGWRRAVRKAAA